MSRAASVAVSGGEHVALCRIERPETRNALDDELMGGLAGRLERLDADPEVRCIVIAGTEEVFASGEVATAAGGEGASEVRFWERITSIETPLVAAVSGWALGAGWELAIACDMVVASETAQFGQPEITLGLIPGGGATQRLARVAGRQRAMELVLTGKRIGATEAKQLGLVNLIAKRRAWLETASQLAAEVASRPPLAVRLAKRAVAAADRLPLDQGIAFEREQLARARTSADRLEALEALTEGRPPRFTDR